MLCEGCRQEIRGRAHKTESGGFVCGFCFDELIEDNEEGDDEDDD